MIGIFGGTFDPVHIGHLRPVLEVHQALHFDEVRLIPCFQPPHRGVPEATPQQRLAMLKLAVREVPEFIIDERELQRGGPSYMVDTLLSLRQEIGVRPLCLILGMDAFRGLAGWNRWRQLIELAHLVVVRRPGNELPTEGEVAALLCERRVDAADQLRAHPAGALWVQEVTLLDISATYIRRDVHAGRDIRFLVPEAVRHYIEAQGLYR